MSSLSVGYVIYLIFTVSMTIFVGNSLHRHGRLFVIDCFHGNSVLADNVNHLLLVGFYLTNIALVLLQLRSRLNPANDLDIAHIISAKIGLILITLGVMHLFNVLVLMRIRCQRSAIR